MLYLEEIARIKSLSEYDLFKDFIGHHSADSASDFFLDITAGNFIVTKEQVKEKLKIKRNDMFLEFTQIALAFNPDSKPDRIGYTDLVGHKNYIGYYNNTSYFVPLNVLTIGKTNKELNDLGKWCGLWD